MVDAHVIELRSGDLEVGVCPGIGGCITHLRHRGQDLMRPAPELSGPGDVRKASSFPLVPFSNRVGHARFTFEGGTYTLQPNFPPEPHAIHGFGWEQAWQVAGSSDTAAEITLDHSVPDTPFVYGATQRFTLDATSLRLEIGLVNKGSGRMPAGIGHHPYFVRTPGTTLQTRLEAVWMPDDDKLPKERVPLPAEWDFGPGIEVDTITTDHCFAGFGGDAVISWPATGARLTIQADPVFEHAVIYIPEGRPYFCIEPVSNANDAFNLAERGVANTGLVILEPGESLAGTVVFRVG